MKILTQPTFQRITWVIRDFWELPQEEEFFLDSPEFLYRGDPYSMRLYPKSNEDKLKFHVRRLSGNSPVEEVSCGIRLRKRERNGDEGYVYCLRSLQKNHCYSRSAIERDRDEFVPDGSLTIVCTMSRAGSSGQGEEEQGRFPDIEKLQSDFKRLLQKEEESDSCFVVHGKEFRVHRNVLRARSKVFEAMFGHDTAEKESGRVVVDDLDPDAFEEFLEYLYTGDVEAGLSDDNTFKLYLAADKYDVSTLKSKCVDHMRRTLSVDSFCDVVTLALRHSEEDLLQQSLAFLRDNFQRIIVTAKWQQFNTDNAPTANELFNRAFLRGTR